MRGGWRRAGRPSKNSLTVLTSTSPLPGVPDGRSLARGYDPRGVDFDLTSEQELLRDTVRTFARDRVAPVAAELDLEARFPYELVAELAELGLMGIPVPEEHEGAGGRTASSAAPRRGVHALRSPAAGA